MVIPLLKNGINVGGMGLACDVCKRLLEHSKDFIEKFISKLWPLKSLRLQPYYLSNSKFFSLYTLLPYLIPHIELKLPEQ